MRIKRTIIIPAILALSAAGSILVGSAVPAATALAPSTHFVGMAPSTHFVGMAPSTHFVGVTPSTHFVG